jgi:hypothetical protein
MTSVKLSRTLSRQFRDSPDHFSYLAITKSLGFSLSTVSRFIYAGKREPLGRWQVQAVSPSMASSAFMQGVIVTPSSDVWIVGVSKNQVVYIPKGDENGWLPDCDSNFDSHQRGLMRIQQGENTEPGGSGGASWAAQELGMPPPILRVPI